MKLSLNIDLLSNFRLRRSIPAPVVGNEVVSQVVAEGSLVGVVWHPMPICLSESVVNLNLDLPASIFAFPPAREAGVHVSFDPFEEPTHSSFNTGVKFGHFLLDPLVSLFPLF